MNCTQACNILKSAYDLAYYSEKNGLMFDLDQFRIVCKEHGLCLHRAITPYNFVGYKFTVPMGGYHLDVFVGWHGDEYGISAEKWDVDCYGNPTCHEVL